MTSLEIAKKAAQMMDDRKAKNIKVIGIKEISSLGDYFVLATGTSSTQVQALADVVEMKLKEQGISPYSVEGYRSNGWILLDYGSVLVHVFTTEARDYYDLDRLWSDGVEVEIDFGE
jgi:ribosome-associated protein